jgi:uncharacterized membrane protein (DUF106 family)
MKALKKIVIIMLFMLVASSALTLLIRSVNAAGNLSCQASISVTNSGVAESASYSFNIINVGETNIGAAKITVPSGYSNVRNIVVSQKPTSENWTITIQNNDILLNSSALGLSSGQNVTFSFDAKNPQSSGTYKWIIGVNENNSIDALNTPEFTLDLSHTINIDSISAAIIVFAIAGGIAFINTVVNRVLINFFVGWEQYRVMQKEMNEYRSESMAAARANDKKQMEKLKKRQSQINAMQAKMMKPQMVQLGISFIYIFVWFFVLTPTYGITSLVYIPGFGPISVIYWYPICSFFLGLLASRLIGIMPLET